MRRTRVEPDVEDIGLFVERRSAAVWAGKPFRQQLFRRQGVPDIRILLRDPGCDVIDRLAIEDLLAARATIECGNADAPRALSAEAPVGTVRHHRADSVDAHWWVPDGLFDRL